MWWFHGLFRLQQEEYSLQKKFENCCFIKEKSGYLLWLFVFSKEVRVPAQHSYLVTTYETYKTLSKKTSSLQDKILLLASLHFLDNSFACSVLIILAFSFIPA